MKQKVIIKSNKFGLVVYMDPQSDFDEILEEIKVKFIESSRVF